MAKAWMPFYVADYLADTGHLSHEEHGIYFLALLHYWQTEQPLTANAEQLQMICRCFDKQKFSKLWSTVGDLFVLKGQVYHHKRMDVELLKSKKLSEIRAKAGKAKAKQMQSKCSSNAKQLQTQSQSQEKHIVQYDYKGDFENVWKEYPNRVGKKEALRHYKSTVKDADDAQDVLIALANYKEHLSVNDWKKPQNGSTWFNNWQDWLDWVEPQQGKINIQDFMTGG